MTRTKKSKNMKGKSGGSAQQKQKRKTAGRSPQFASAPVGVSDMKIQYTRFERGSGDSSLVMHSCAALTNLNISSVGSAGSVATMQFNGSAIQRQSAQLALTQLVVAAGGTSVVDNMISPAWDLIASAFTRYRVKRCIFHYRPQSTTTQAGRLVFAFAADPDHPLIFSSTPSTNKLLACADSIPFAPWNAWSMDVTSRINRDMLMYTFDPSGATTEGSDRFGSFGSIGCLADTTQVGGPSIGLIYIEMTVEFVEFCPVSSSGAPLGFAALPRRQFEAPRRVRRTEEGESDSASVDTGDKADSGFRPREGSPKAQPPLSSAQEELGLTLQSVAEKRWKVERACLSLVDELKAAICEIECDPEFPKSWHKTQEVEKLQAALEIVEQSLPKGLVQSVQ